MKIADKLINGLIKKNIKIDDIFVDPLVQPVSVDVSFGMEFLNAIEKITDEFPGIHTACGLSNISYGLPERKFLNQTFIVMAIAKGLDGAIGVFSAVEGVEPQSETVWRQADKYRVPKVAFVNKMDRIGSDFFGTVEMMRAKLKANTLVMQLPVGEAESFSGVIWIPVSWDASHIQNGLTRSNVPASRP